MIFKRKPLYFGGIRKRIRWVYEEDLLPVPSSDVLPSEFLLMETGDFLLLEDGFKIILE